MDLDRVPSRLVRAKKKKTGNGFVRNRRSKEVRPTTKNKVRRRVASVTPRIGSVRWATGSAVARERKKRTLPDAEPLIRLRWSSPG